MHRLIGALLAASMLAPAAAQAQRDGDTRTEQRGPRGDRDGRGPGGFGADRSRANFDRADTPRADVDRADRSGPDFDRRRGDRRDRGDERQPPAGFGQPPSDRADRGGHRGFGDDTGIRRGRDLRIERDRAFNAGRNDDRDRSRLGGRDWRDDRNRDDRWRDDRSVGWNDRDRNGRNWDDRNGDRSNWSGRDGNRWNRGWQGQSRYDWIRYRDANRGAFRLPRYYAPGGWSGGYRRFGIGISLSNALWGQNYWISDPYAYRLPEAYGPYRWVRYYDDALLVDLRGGQVVDAVYGIFW